MEISSRNSRGPRSQSSSAARQRQSGYEPSDTETDWPESPPLDQNQRNGDLGFEGPSLGSNQTRRTSSFRLIRRETAKFEVGLSSPIKPSNSPVRRKQSKSPFKPGRDDGNTHLPAQVSDFHRNGSSLSPEFALDSRKNVSPFSKLEYHRFISPHKPVREGNDFVNNEIVCSKRKHHHRQLSKDTAAEGWGSHSHVNEISRVSEKSTYSSRSVSAPRPRLREKDQQIKYGRTEQNGDRKPSPLLRNMLKEREASRAKTPLVGEINEMVANAKISRAPFADAESTDSISQGDIFFSRDYADLSMTMQKIVFPQNDGVESTFMPKPTFFTGKNCPSQQQNKANGSFGHKNQGNSSSTVLTRTTTTFSTAVSRQSSDKISSNSSVLSGTSGNFRKFVANRRKSQAEAWFSCIKKGSCRTSNSPERNREIDEASFIEKAFVVESLRQFWADKHQPASLNGFTCQKQQARVLKQLASHKNCPHILLEGPSGSGKKALTMALLREIFGEPAWDISHDLRYFRIQESRPMQVFVPITSSAHHVELNVYLEPNVRYALMALVKQISSSYAITTPEISTANFKTDYKVMVLYEVDKAAENIQHLIKWIMDCYTESCKLILCCEDDANILEPVKSLCKVIKVDAPVTHEIMEVLIQLARKEDFELPMSFAAKIANKSKQNLRKAIMALEACKSHNYPFVDDQPIPLGWEEVLEEIAAEILADPSQKRLFSVRGKFQKLLLDFVHPKLILQKLVEQFLKGVDASLKRELYYWHAYYDKRLPTGASALLKLEEFVAKFMSMQRKKSNNPRYYP